MASSSPQVIHVIQEIKDSVEKPRRWGWAESLQSEEAKRLRIRRYRDGAVKIMDLLGPDLSSDDVVVYQDLYDALDEIPERWTNDRLEAAKNLWEYVLSLDEWLSHERITSSPHRSWRSRHRLGGFCSTRPAEATPERKVRFEDERPSRSAHKPTNDAKPPSTSYFPPWYQWSPISYPSYGWATVSFPVYNLASPQRAYQLSGGTSLD
ncbi:hypothetical protein ONZ51_g2856 [Trametes cubensis]|uniref:Uncharacterized protein n=1 Tax=Trametes cubensis TaxID=1111947 RepID=A0AAD7TYU7_9APHY|nr:hypothetical protein ONZ51_g2856 [Trametes cubensis]